MTFYPIRFTRAISVTRFHITELEQGKLLGKSLRAEGYKTRIVYRGPRNKVKHPHWTRSIVDGSTRKKDAVGFDLYVFKK